MAQETQTATAPVAAPAAPAAPATTTSTRVAPGRTFTNAYELKTPGGEVSTVSAQMAAQDAIHTSRLPEQLTLQKAERTKASEKAAALGLQSARLSNGSWVGSPTLTHGGSPIFVKSSNLSSATLIKTNLVWPAAAGGTVGRLWLALLTGSRLICSPAEATIIHVPQTPPIYELWIFRDPVPLEIDINQDGTADVGLYKDLGIGMLTYGQTAVFGMLKGGYLPGLNTRDILVTAFQEGQVIGAESAMESLTSEFWARNSDSPDDLTYFQLASGVPSNIGSYGGTFFGKRAYLGMRIELAPGEFHYGWVDIANTLARPWNYEIRGWAWESGPNQAIIAGAIPEPSSWLLAGLGAFGLLMIRRRAGET